MPRQIQAKPTKRKKIEPAVEDAPKATGHVTVEELDGLLDEIDAVLEENALEVLRTYVQRGGE